MAASRSFTDYVRKKYDNEFWAAAGQFIEDNQDYIESLATRVHTVGETEIADVHVEHVWVEDRPEMEISFDVALSVKVEVHDGNHHYDSSEEKTFWLMVSCRGDLNKKLEDFEILQVLKYNGKNRVKDPMDDSLVPVLSPDQMDSEAEAFLRRHNFHKALIEPCWIQPDELAKQMGLTIRMVNITKDGSVFGRCYFDDCETELYDPDTDSMYKEVILARTILVDSQAAFMSNIGRYHNTIVHECVHWDYHRKAFALARLYDSTLTNIGCRVFGGADGNKRDAVDWMEWQANALTPRIQMPMSVFKKRVRELISKFRRETDEYDVIDIIQPIIDQLAIDFGVSRTAAKIRMIDAGYEEAKGAFIYVDGHYVPPHKSERITLEKNQTFSLGARDAVILFATNRAFRERTAQTDYQYIDSHFVLNHPAFIEEDILGNMHLTHYARNHMEECCLIFDLQIENQVGQYYHSECFLNRDERSPVSFRVVFSGGYENASPDRQNERLRKIIQEEHEMFGKLTADYKASLQTVIEWRGLTYKEIGEIACISPETVSRCVKGERKDLNTLFLICLALHLPYNISIKIINDAGFTFSYVNPDHVLYEFVLQHMYGSKMSEIREFLNAQGAKSA